MRWWRTHQDKNRGNDGPGLKAKAENTTVAAGMIVLWATAPIYLTAEGAESAESPWGKMPFLCDLCDLCGKLAETMINAVAAFALDS